MTTRLLRATVVAILVCSGLDASFAQAPPGGPMTLQYGGRLNIEPNFKPKVTLTGFINSENVRFRWRKKGGQNWGDAKEGKLIPPSRLIPASGSKQQRQGEFWVPAPHGQNSEVCELCAEEGSVTAQCPYVFTINSKQSECSTALSRLGLRGILVGYPDGELMEAAPLSLRESGLMLRRALIAEGRATAASNTPLGSLLVAHGIWTGTEEANYTGWAAGAVSRKDFAGWMGRLVAGDKPGLLASTQPWDIATEQGIVKGYPGGDLSWAKPVTRGEAGIMLDRALAIIGKPVE